MEKVFNAPKKRKASVSTGSKKKNKLNDEEEIDEDILIVESLPPFVQINAKFSLQKVNHHKTISF